MILAATVMMTACGGQPQWELYIAQMPMAVLPESGQAIYTLGSRSVNQPIGYVVSAEAADYIGGDHQDGYIEIRNVFKLQVDSQALFLDGQKLTWSNGQGTILRATHFQLYGVTGEM